LRDGVMILGRLAAYLVPMCLAWPGGPAWAADDVAAGKALYESKCGGCHSVDANRIGPLHRGVVGRKIASISDFAYSPAIRKLSGTWTPEKLDKWLTDPQKVAPGTAMYFQDDEAAERRAIIAYLKSVSVPGGK
jgi:cytochrome c